MSEETLDPMWEVHATIAWCPMDIAKEYGLSDDKSVEIMQAIAKGLIDRSTEFGYDYISSRMNEFFIGENE